MRSQHTLQPTKRVYKRFCSYLTRIHYAVRLARAYHLYVCVASNSYSSLRYIACLWWIGTQIFICSTFVVVVAVALLIYGNLYLHFTLQRPKNLLMKQSKYNTHRCVHRNCGRYLSQIQRILPLFRWERLSISNFSTINRVGKGQASKQLHEDI